MLFNLFIPIQKLNVQQLNIFRDSLGILKLKIAGESAEYAFKPIKCFPLTDSERYLGLFKIMSGQTIKEEIALVDDLNKLNEESRRLIEEEINKEFSLTWIKKIHSVGQTKNTSRWRVDTDKGEQTFEVEHQTEIYMIQPSLVVIEGTQGNVFALDPSQLDSKSLSLLEIYK
ncbi:MAG: DUF1854 domain-containing protein [Candidatus Omnitrophota bacterium]